jgi:ribonuclease BN (tRNA processing enzyme)
METILRGHTMAVTLEVLGCGDAFGAGGRFHSCYLLAAGDELTLVDCGASAPAALQQREIAQPDIGMVLLTHLHGDHFGGVPFLLLDAAYNRRRARPLVIAGPEGLDARISGALEVLFPGAPARVRQHVPLSYVELAERTATDLDGLRVTPFPVQHPSGAPSYALRVEMGGRTIAFSGDAAWDPVLLEASRNADLFVCECTAYRDPVPYHVSLTDLQGHASELSAQRVLLTHLGREMLQHTEQAPWPCAADGMVVAL